MTGSSNKHENTDKTWREITKKLLKDRTTHKNIRWTTDNRPITIKQTKNIKPRTTKDTQEKKHRTLHKAEVFTPIWVVNKQNNMIDEKWFGHRNIFNTEKPDKTWETRKEKIKFPEEKTWKQYVKDTRLEMSCGEAPYLTSRYDPTTGKEIPLKERTGILDRKLRIVDENTKKDKQYREWLIKALQNTYGFELQGDNLLIARKNILKTCIENYENKTGNKPDREFLEEILGVITWNIWQMDLTTCTVPNTCREIRECTKTLTGEEKVSTKPCPGCRKKGDIREHTGIYAKIYDWETNNPVRFLDCIKQDQ